MQTFEPNKSDASKIKFLASDLKVYQCTFENLPIVSLSSYKNNVLKVLDS